MNRFKHILCIMEPSGANNFALERAVTLAENNQASLTLIDVIPRITSGTGMPEHEPGSANLQSAMKKNELQKLQNLYVKQAKQKHANCLDKVFNEVSATFEQKTQNYINPQKDLAKGQTDVEISALAQKIKADLIVKGAVVRTDIAGFIMGNTAESILNQLHCSILAIKPPGFVTPVTLED